MSEIRLILPDGASCESIEQLRTACTDEWAIKVLEDGSLLAWLEAMYYEQEAKAVKDISTDVRDEEILKEFRTALGLETSSEPSKAELRLKELTDDPELLKKADSAAFNQHELAELLNRNCTDILLCKGEFNIPLSKEGVTYTAVGEPSVSAPNRVEMAKHHIRLNGYTLDSDTDNSAQLAELIEAFSLPKYEPYLHLTSNCSNDGKRYDNKHDCLEKRNSIVSKLYREAAKYLSPSDSCRISKVAVEYYCKALTTVFETNKKQLYRFGATDQQIAELQTLCSSYKQLLRACDEELQEGDFYRLYKQSYFEELIDVEEFEDLKGGAIFEWNLHKVKTYYLTNCYKPRDELEKDLNELARSMWCFAYSEYLNTVQRPIHKLLTEIAANGSDSESA